MQSTTVNNEVKHTMRKPVSSGKLIMFHTLKPAMPKAYSTKMN